MTKKVVVLWMVLSSFLLCDTYRITPLSAFFKTEFILKKKSVHIWLAIDPKQKQEGLSFLSPDEVRRDTGMLFIYPINEVLSFWMKDTYIDLDLAYIDEKGNVTDIFQMPKMLTKFYSSIQKVRYVLELRAGEFKKIGLKVGDKITIPIQIKAFAQP